MTITSRFLIYCILLFISNTLEAQSSADSAAIFQLDKLMFIAGKHASNGKFAEAKQLLEKVVSMSKGYKMIDYEVNALVAMGRYTAAESNSRQVWNVDFQKALTVANTGRNKGQEAAVLAALAARYAANLKTDSTRLFVGRTLKILREHPEDAAGAMAFASLAFIYHRFDVDSALICGRIAVALSNRVDNPEYQITALNALANAYALNNELDSTRQTFLRALAVARAKKKSFAELTLLQNAVNSHNGLFVRDSVETFQARSWLINGQVGGVLDSLRSMQSYAETMSAIGHYPVALKMFLDLLKQSMEKNDSATVTTIALHITELYMNLADYELSNRYAFLAHRFSPKTFFFGVFTDVYAALNFGYLKMPDSVKFYASRGLQTAEALSSTGQIYGGVFNTLGVAYLEIGESKISYNYLHRAYRYFKTLSGDKVNLLECYKGLALFHLRNNRSDSAVYYARQLIKLNTRHGYLHFTTDACQIMVDFFKSRGRYDSAYFYQQIGFENYKRLFNAKNGSELLRISLDDQQKALDLESQQKLAQATYRSNLKLYGLSGLLVFSLAVGTLLVVGARQRKKAFDLLRASQAEIIEQKDKIEASLKEVKQFQSQLVQSEKMAGLGELTAGIAHEIQNPLNFINNFSEVNQELVMELQHELDNGNMTDAKIIANDIRVNEAKINHHGKRADAIVKGMLQHSRSSTGQKEATDINALCEEYLRLSYHGLRAKDKSFNAKFTTDFDPSLPKVNVIPQDIGRVILNLVNNAFYAVNEKGKRNIPGYEPTVSISTRNLSHKIQITVKDNGDGIPEKIKEKIFQPFFTTKPTGQGTGLGLSLSYDIVKAHNGHLSLASETSGTAFLILIPI